MDYDDLKNLASSIWLKEGSPDSSTMITPVVKSENRTLIRKITDLLLNKRYNRLETRERIIRKRSHPVLQSTYNMNLQGLKLLMDKDDIRFRNWKIKSRDLTLEELRKSYDFWLKYYRDTYQIYKDLGSGGSVKDMAIYSAKMTYFHSLSNYVLETLTAYTSKLQEEYGLSRPRNERASVGRRVKQLQKTSRTVERRSSRGPFP